MRFDEFAATRLSDVLRFAGVLTGDRALAEDIVPEVLLRAHKRLRIVISPSGTLIDEEYVTISPTPFRTPVASSRRPAIIECS
jgi:hypothetical protein